MPVKATLHQFLYKNISNESLSLRGTASKFQLKLWFVRKAFNEKFAFFISIFSSCVLQLNLNRNLYQNVVLYNTFVTVPNLLKLIH